MRSTFVRVAVVAPAIATLMLTALVGTAAAHERKAYHGYDYALVTLNHVEIQVHDIECDGNGVYAEAYYYEYGLSKLMTIWDAGCRDWHPGYGKGQAREGFYMFRVCENRVGCSYWHGV